MAVRWAGVWTAALIASAIVSAGSASPSDLGPPSVDHREVITADLDGGKLAVVEAAAAVVPLADAPAIGSIPPFELPSELPTSDRPPADPPKARTPVLWMSDPGSLMIVLTGLVGLAARRRLLRRQRLHAVAPTS